MGTAIPFLILYLFFYCVQHVSAVKNGIVGFGIPLSQDLCCQSCHDSLSSLYLSCTTFQKGEGDMPGMSMDMGMGGLHPTGETSEECYATNIPWLQTMAYCIQQNCNADGYGGVEKQAKCFRTQAVAGALRPTFEDSLPAIAPTVELSEDDLWLNVTSLVNRNTYYATYGTLKEFTRSEYIHTRYS